MEDKKPNKEIASILFMPVCTKCLKIIWETIDVQQRVGAISAAYDISPDKCPYCGTWFNNIAIPTKLPFNAYDYVT